MIIIFFGDVDCMPMIHAILVILQILMVYQKFVILMVHVCGI